MYSDMHNDALTINGSIIDTKGLINYAVWSTYLAEEDTLKICRKASDTGLLFSVEDVSNIGDLDSLIDLNPYCISITWNNNNRFGGGAYGDIGLTSEGSLVISKYSNNGIYIDTSHMNEETFWDYCDIATMPIINTHSCIREVYSHPRNISLDMVDKIVSSGGLIGINSFSRFVGGDSIELLVRHIDTVVQRFGDRCVCIGTDIYGCDTPIIIDYSIYENISICLDRIGYSRGSIDNILYKNFLFCIKDRYNIANLSR